MITAQEFNQKYGSLVQYGVAYMTGFNVFADLFVSKYNQYKPEIDQSGVSLSWTQWLVDNQNQVIELHDDLLEANMIPTSPVE